MNPAVLFSARVCPFAQRSRMMLIEKGAEFETREVDLDAPDPEFLRLSPLAKVPLLLHGEGRIWESTVINEYLEEVLDGPSLMPSGALSRARVRIWVDYANSQFVPWFYKLLLQQDPVARAEHGEQLLARLKFMEQGLGESAGPYWSGASPSLADLAFYPFFERFCVLNHYRNFHLPASCPRLQDWFDAMRRRDSVRRTGNPVAFYIERYARYADGSTTSDTAAEMRSL